VGVCVNRIGKVDTIPVWSSFLNYGPIAPDGKVVIYLSVDHRVIDGRPAACAVRALEAMLNGPVLDKLRALAGAGRATAPWRRIACGRQYAKSG
jgi:hypothetical protein